MFREEKTSIAGIHILIKHKPITESRIFLSSTIELRPFNSGFHGANAKIKSEGFCVE